IAVEVDHHGLFAARRHVPGDELLAVAGREHDLLRLRQAGLGGAAARRDRMIEHRALHHVEQAYEQNVGADAADQEPTYESHASSIAPNCHRMVTAIRRSRLQEETLSANLAQGSKFSGE